MIATGMILFGLCDVLLPIKQQITSMENKIKWDRIDLLVVIWG